MCSCFDQGNVPRVRVVQMSLDQAPRPSWSRSVRDIKSTHFRYSIKRPRHHPSTSIRYVTRPAFTFMPSTQQQLPSNPTPTTSSKQQHEQQKSGAVSGWCDVYLCACIESSLAQSNSQRRRCCHCFGKGTSAKVAQRNPSTRALDHW